MAIEHRSLLKAAVFNGSTKGSGNRTDSRASVANAALFNGSTHGILGDVLGEDGHGGTAAIDLRQILSDLGVSDLVEDIFGKGGPLELGIRADVVEEDARAWCDRKGNPHSAARLKLLNLHVNGKPIRVSMEPNQTIDLGVVKIVINAQSKSEDGGSIDAAALTVTVRRRGGREAVPPCVRARHLRKSEGSSTTRLAHASLQTNTFAVAHSFAHAAPRAAVTTGSWWSGGVLGIPRSEAGNHAAKRGRIVQRAR